MTEQTQRALERVGPGVINLATAELWSRSPKLLELLDELCNELVGAGLCVREEAALHKAQVLLRETTRAMLGEK